ncbi:unnamed protein product [Vicia faba]|uniref:Uncharacterized protein n=1 Tax=Vicia faba TaxID=3906 RepID=A0AAV1BA57_VICFA|nr:unnamed protein product [Vicia faba]
MEDGDPWRRAKIPPYRTLCGAVIADYDGNTLNIGRYLLLQRAQKLTCISAIAAMAPLFDNSVEYQQCADIFTKALPPSKFEEFRVKLTVRDSCVSPTVQLAGGIKELVSTSSYSSYCALAAQYPSPYNYS